MNKEKLIPVFVVSILLLSNVAFAAGSISITSITIPSSVSVGDSFTITVSVSGSQISDVKGTLTLPSGLSCTPIVSQTISLGGGGTGSASWSCTADVAGDYTNQITASVTATDSGTGGSLSDNRQTGLSVLSPASLTVSSAISSTSVTVGSSVTFTVGVNNVGDESTTYNISLDYPSGLTCSPSSVASNSIDGNTLENNAFTITGNTVGSYTLTATVTGNDQTLTTSKSLTVSAAAATTTTPGGGGGGTSPKTTTTTILVTTTLPVGVTTVLPGETTTIISETTVPVEIPLEVGGIPIWIIGLVIIVVVVIVAVVWKYKPRKKILPGLKEF